MQGVQLQLPTPIMDIAIARTHLTEIQHMAGTGPEIYQGGWMAYV